MSNTYFDCLVSSEALKKQLKIFVYLKKKKNSSAFYQGIGQLSSFIHDHEQQTKSE